MEWEQYLQSRMDRSPSGRNFPTRDQIWHGLVLGTIAQVAYAGGDTHEWIGPVCLINNGSGDAGVITVRGDAVVALLFFHEDKRNPWPGGRPTYDSRPFLADMPMELKGLLQQYARPLMSSLTSGYAHDTVTLTPGPDGTVTVSGADLSIFVVTAAFWGFGNNLTAVEPWTEVFAHGGHLLDTHLFSPTDAMIEWQSIYDLSSDEVARVWDLYERRIAWAGQYLTISHGEWEALEKDARTRHHQQWQASMDPTFTLSEERRLQQDREHAQWASDMLLGIGIILAD